MIRASSGKTAAVRMLIGAGVLALLIPAIAGCEAGNDAPTLEYHAASAGAHTVFNNITITNVFVLGAPSGSTVGPGKTASVFLALFNGGPSSDELTSVTAPGTAASVSLSGGTVALPSGTAVNLTGPQPDVVLTNLKTPLTGGSSIPLTLTFQHAGTVNLTVPVQPQSFYYATYSAPAATPSATPKPETTVAPTPVVTTPVATNAAQATPKPSKTK